MECINNMIQIYLWYSFLRFCGLVETVPGKAQKLTNMDGVVTYIVYWKNHNANK